LRSDARLFDGAHDDLVGNPLLVEQHELLAVADLARGDLEQLLRRGDGRRE